jgi:hypothetical protein
VGITSWRAMAALVLVGADPAVQTLFENFFSSIFLHDVKVAQLLSESWQHAALYVCSYLIRPTADRHA